MMTVVEKQIVLPVGDARPRRSVRTGRLSVWWGRLVVLALFLVAWEYLPQVEWFSSRFRFLDPFFVSSPSSAAQAVYDYAFGSGGRPGIWPFLGLTVRSALIGLVLGSVLGVGLGLLLSSVRYLNDVLTMFIQAANSIPTIALIPIVIALVGIGVNTEITISTISVFFVVFFTSLEGGRRVPPAVLDNAQVLGATRWQMMRRVRVRYVLLYTFASMPNAVAHCVLAVIVMQILAGTGGIGLLMLVATTAIDTTTNIALIVYLTVTVVLMVQIAEYVKRRILFWAEDNR
jgi:NitT/TauT family transport system permease protein